MKLTIIGSIFLVALLSGCGGSSATNSNPTATPKPTAAAQPTSAPSGSTASATGICGYVNSAKLQVQILADIKSNPSLSSLTAALKKLLTELRTAAGKSSAMLQPGFTAVESADTQVQNAIKQLQSSGAPQATWAGAIKGATAGLTGAFNGLVAANKCT